MAAADSDLELDTVKRQVDIYRQLRDALASAAAHSAHEAGAAAQQDREGLYEQSRSQLLASVKRYRERGKGGLADLIERAVAGAAA